MFLQYEADHHAFQHGGVDGHTQARFTQYFSSSSFFAFICDFYKKGF